MTKQDLARFSSLLVSFLAGAGTVCSLPLALFPLIAVTSFQRMSLGNPLHRLLTATQLATLPAMTLNKELCWDCPAQLCKKQALTSVCFLKTAHPRHKGAMSCINDTGNDNGTLFISLVPFLKKSTCEEPFFSFTEKWPHHCFCASLHCLGLPLVLAWSILQRWSISEIPSKNLHPWCPISFFLLWVSYQETEITGTAKLKGVC